MIIKASASITLTRVDDGDDGKGIKSIVNKYLASSSGSNVTTATSGWTNTIQTITTSKRYLWNYEVITYTDNSTTTTTPVIIGVYGNTGSTGATGNGISSITEYYLVSPNKSGVTTSTSGWSTTIPTMTATNKYLWNYEVIKYTNSTTSTGTPKVIGIYGDKGDKGDKGETGVGISSVDVEYYLSTSSTAQSGGSWSTTAPTWVDGKYMWSRTKTVTTAGKTSYSNPVCITGGKGNTGATGATGATGKGVSSITEEYYLSTSKTTQTGGSWVTAPPTWSSGKYMWTRSKIVYTNPASTVYTAPVCDSSWEAVNGLQIGGRNLALGTGTATGDVSSGHNGSPFKTTDLLGGITAIKTNTQWSGRYFNLKNIAQRGGFKSGDNLVLSVYIKSDENVTLNVTCHRTKGSGNTAGSSKAYNGFTVTPKWQQVWFPFTADDGSLNRTDARIEVNITTGTNNIYWAGWKLEKGTTVTDWTPAPEDVDGSISSLTERVSRAEQKITDSAIISTVQSTINTAKNEAISSANTNTANQLKNYATTSSLTQTADSITAKFTGTGGFNLLKNSDAKNGTYMWSGNGKTLTIGTSGSSPFIGGNEFKSTFPNGLRYSENIKLKANTEYVYEAWVYTNVAYSGSAAAPMHFWCNTTAGASGNTQAEILDYRQKLNAGAFTKVYVHFRTKGGDVYFTPFIYGGATDSICVARQISLREGKVEMPWTPHPSEIYEGSTVIDASGVTVKNGAIKVQNKNGENVMTSDTNGNLILSGGNMKIQNQRGGLTDIAQFFGGAIGPGLTLTSYVTDTGNQQSSVAIRLSPDDVDRMEIMAENVAITGNKGGSLSANTVHASSTSTNQLWINNNQVFNGSDTWIRTYGNTGWYSQTYGGGWYMTDSTWIRAYNNKGVYTGGNIESGSDMRCSNKLYFTAGEMGYYAYAQWYNNKACIRMPNVATQDMEVDGNATVRGGVMYLGRSSNSSWVGFYDSTGNRRGYIGKGDPNSNLIYLASEADKTIVTTGHLCPSGNRMYWVGTNSPARQWKGLCAEGGTVGASDIRSKENIERLDGTIVGYDETTEEVKEYQLYNLRSTARASARDYYEFIKDRFKPSYYNYKLSEVVNEETGEYTIDPADEYNMLKNVGFIAQDYDLETDSVAREFIFQNESGEYSYNHMSYVTVGMIALQEATKKIDLLENENMDLKERLSKLENLVNQIISK